MNIFRYKRPAFWAGVVLAVVLAAVLLGLAVNPEEQYTQDESYKKEEQPVALEDFLMGQTEMPLGDGTVTDSAEDPFWQAMHYAGYLDESPYSMWKNDWNDCDFDGDGKRDRVYRDVTGTAVSYRIDFGNGGVLDIGSFEDAFTGLSLQSADADGDGDMEILFVGAHMASTDPYSNSEIAFFYKENGSYRMAHLPGAYDAAGNERGAYETGWDIYASAEGENAVTFYSNSLAFRETVELEAGLSFAEIFSRDEKTVYATGTAYDAEFIEYDGEVCLVFYENPGGKWLYQPVCVIFAIDEQDSRQTAGRIKDVRLLTKEEAARRTIAGTTEAKKANANMAAVQSTGGEKTTAHREGFVEPTLHLHVTDYLADSVYIDTSFLPEGVQGACREDDKERVRILGSAGKQDRNIG